MGTLCRTWRPSRPPASAPPGATDVWAAGLTLYSHLAGRNPFKARTLPDLLEKLREGARPLHETRPDIPRAVSDVLAAGARPRPAPPARRDRAARPAARLPRAQARPGRGARRRTGARACPAARPRAAALHPLTARVGGSAIAAATTLFVLTAFPFYPTTWTLPLAAVLAVVAWFRPLTALTAGAVLCVPAFWNLAAGRRPAVDRHVGDLDPDGPRLGPKPCVRAASGLAARADRARPGIRAGRRDRADPAAADRGGHPRRHHRARRRRARPGRRERRRRRGQQPARVSCRCSRRRPRRPPSLSR